MFNSPKYAFVITVLFSVLLTAVITTIITYLIFNKKGDVQETALQTSPTEQLVDTSLNQELGTTPTVTSDISTQTFIHPSGSYSVQYPSDWSQGVNGTPDPELLEYVYFFRNPAEDSKGFDRVDITRFSEQGSSFDGLLELHPEHIIHESNGITYVLTYNNDNFPEETRKIFELISNSFELK